MVLAKKDKVIVT